ncbi:inactive peptidyl-prolyl cis-trans isomerase shutdown-like [Lucilia cuprina]|uniref:inactive peptidyl-prolyl cis-trans isomerase shutdown-like n=1 Tax=Lucilia cuprina TaxID=7375 RepID=UPI001F050A04|nr:inactive peptidyl-prolyl cis-trans isomerase shutdown-like [Lucilia cuprina]XP_046806477.1 inactive peptidyl-prolyl cis-trans isomerase shutdown-like [Lucilia cuprina]
MEDDGIPVTNNFLKDPLCLGDLISSGASFEINTNFDEGFTNDIYDELNIGSDEEQDDGKNAFDRNELVSPWTEPFEDLKPRMQKLNEHVWKKITKVGLEQEPVVPNNARVCIRYNAYWEGEGAPFDSSFLRGSSYSFYTGRNEVLEGLEVAVRTMHKGEHAQFVISYHLLFREMGCPPRVKPKADGLFIIELVSYNLVGDIDADQQIAEQDRNKFTVVIDKVKEIHLKGLDFFSQGTYRNACRAFEKAVDILKFCRLANDQEEKEQSSFLIKLYTNLAVCYNKINAPGKTCLMCKEIRELTHNKPSCKALFQEGRAYLMLGEYEKARHLLVKAQHLEPQNLDIGKELKILDERYKRYKENERKIWTKAMGIIKTVQKTDDANANNGDAAIFTLKEEMMKLMREFKEDEEQNNLKLPAGLTNKEIETVDELAKQLDLKLSLNPLDNSSYTVTKKK